MGDTPKPPAGTLPLHPFGWGKLRRKETGLADLPGARPVSLYSQHRLRYGLPGLVGLFGIAERSACPRPGVVGLGLRTPLGLQFPGPLLDDVGVEYHRVPPLMLGPA